MGQRIVLAIVLACIVSACEKKPSGQTVAVVNNEEITAADLNAELAKEAYKPVEKALQNSHLKQ